MLLLNVFTAGFGQILTDRVEIFSSSWVSFSSIRLNSEHHYVLIEKWTGDDSSNTVEMNLLNMKKTFDFASNDKRSLLQDKTNTFVLFLYFVVVGRAMEAINKLPGVDRMSLEIEFLIYWLLLEIIFKMDITCKT